MYRHATGSGDARLHRPQIIQRSWGRLCMTFMPLIIDGVIWSDRARTVLA